MIGQSISMNFLGFMKGFRTDHTRIDDIIKRQPHTSCHSKSEEHKTNEQCNTCHTDLKDPHKNCDKKIDN